MEPPENSLGQIVLLDGDTWLIKHLDLHSGQLMAVLGSNVVEKIQDSDTISVTTESRNVEILDVGAVENKHVEYEHVWCRYLLRTFLLDHFQSRLEQLLLHAGWHQTFQIFLNSISYCSQANVI